MNSYWRQSREQNNALQTEISDYAIKLSSRRAKVGLARFVLKTSSPFVSGPLARQSDCLGSAMRAIQVLYHLWPQCTFFSIDRLSTRFVPNVKFPLLTPQPVQKFQAIISIRPASQVLNGNREADVGEMGMKPIHHCGPTVRDVLDYIRRGFAINKRALSKQPLQQVHVAFAYGNFIQFSEALIIDVGIMRIHTSSRGILPCRAASIIPRKKRKSRSTGVTLGRSDRFRSYVTTRGRPAFFASTRFSPPIPSKKVHHKMWNMAQCNHLWSWSHCKGDYGQEFIAGFS